MWQELHAELAPLGLSVITVALDTEPDDVRPWIERADPGHPSLIDVEKVLADRYHMVNVPTVVWIDEEGRIVRPNDVHYVSTEYSAITRFHPRKPIATLRGWVRGELPPLDGASVAELQHLPTHDDQLARAHYALGWWLTRTGADPAAAEAHFVTAGELAPHDFTIRRGSMPIRGIDPAGPAFFEMTAAWRAAGNDYYLPLDDTATTEDDFAAEPVPKVRLSDVLDE